MDFLIRNVKATIHFCRNLVLDSIMGKVYKILVASASLQTLQRRRRSYWADSESPAEDQGVWTFVEEMRILTLENRTNCLRR